MKRFTLLVALAACATPSAYAPPVGSDITQIAHLAYAGVRVPLTARLTCAVDVADDQGRDQRVTVVIERYPSALPSSAATDDSNPKPGGLNVWPRTIHLSPSHPTHDQTIMERDVHRWFVVGWGGDACNPSTFNVRYLTANHGPRVVARYSI